VTTATTAEPDLSRGIAAVVAPSERAERSDRAERSERSERAAAVHEAAVAARAESPAQGGGGSRAEVSDAEWLARARAGEAAAFRAIYERHASRLLRFAIWPVVRDSAIAEELLGDTFVRAYQALPRYEMVGSSMYPWLVRIARNLAIDHARRARRQGVWPEGLEQLLPDEDPEVDAERAIGGRELDALLRDRIDEILGKLRPRYREVIEARLVSQTPRPEVAERLGVTLATLDVVLFRACAAFRREWIARFGEGDMPMELFR
jgi:RNA polymerase sigma-70 factor (ECF subfamily)